MLKNEIIKSLRGCVSAVRLLSNLPCPGEEAESIGEARSWFPAVGLLLGGLMVSVGWIAYACSHRWDALAAFVMLVFSAWMTRGFHLDGLSDWADGFWGGFTRERTLEIMKDSRVGAFGVIVLVPVLIGKLLAFSMLIEMGEWGWIVSACVLSRTAQVVLAGTQPYARPEGGTGGDFVTGTHPRNIIVPAVIMLIMLLVLTGSVLSVLLVSAIVMGVVLIFGRWCRKKIGGVTGDLLGTCSEMSELLTLILAVCVLGGAQ